MADFTVHEVLPEALPIAASIAGSLIGNVTGIPGLQNALESAAAAAVSAVKNAHGDGYADEATVAGETAAHKAALRLKELAEKTGRLPSEEEAQVIVNEEVNKANKVVKKRRQNRRRSLELPAPWADTAGQKRMGFINSLSPKFDYDPITMGVGW